MPRKDQGKVDDEMIAELSDVVGRKEKEGAEGWTEEFDLRFATGRTDVDGKFIESATTSSIKQFISKIVAAALEGTKGEIEWEVERMHTKHYMEWIPTEEQKGYRKAQMDVLSLIKKQ